MKRLILLIALFSGFSFVYAQGKNSALGFWLQGSTNDWAEWWGVDYKHLGSNAAQQIYGTISYYDHKFTIGGYFGYYFLYNVIKADASAGKFPIYWGPYGGFGYWNDHDYNGVAVRGGVTGGISWLLPELPIDVSLEVTPVIECNFEEDDDNSGFKQLPISYLYFRLMFHYYF
jgi:hypothetical protein